MKWFKTVMGKQDPSVVDAEIIEHSSSTQHFEKNKSQPTALKPLMKRVFALVYPDEKASEVKEDLVTKENMVVLAKELERLQNIVGKKSDNTGNS
jgi:hypothetical protein